VSVASFAIHRPHSLVFTWRGEVVEIIIGVVQSVRNTTDVIYVHGATADKKRTAS
jgi:hypothetical protein